MIVVVDIFVSSLGKLVLDVVDYVSTIYMLGHIRMSALELTPFYLVEERDRRGGMFSRL